MNQETNLKPSSLPALLVLIIVSALFAISVYDFIRSVIFSTDLIANYATYAGYMKIPWWTATFYSSELGGTVGGILHTIAVTLALYAAAVYWRKGNASIPRIKGKVAAALALEAGYYLSFIPTVWLGFIYPYTGGNVWYFEVTPVNEVLFAAGFTSLAMVLVMPPVLFKLRSLIAKEASREDLVRWSAITAVAFLFVVFWFNSTMQWTGMLTTWNPADMLLDPLNFAGFASSVIGLLFVAIFGLATALPAIKKPQTALNQRRIGATAVALGAYFTFGVLVYFAVGGYSSRPMAWYELIVPHNPYLWCLVFLPAGIPLIIAKLKNP
jgi:hypothetical protein